MQSLKTLRKLRVLLVVSLLTLASAARPALKAHPAGESKVGSSKRASKLDIELQRLRHRHGDGAVRVIVKPVSGRQAAAVQKRRAHGDVIRSEHAIVGAFSATIHPDDLDALEADPDVVNVSADAIVTSDVIVNATGELVPSSLLQTLGLDALDDDGPGGKGVGIAVIDSGL
jgi:hypothetical protein